VYVYVYVSRYVCAMYVLSHAHAMLGMAVLSTSILVGQVCVLVE
jgi:hypothetical protein